MGVRIHNTKAKFKYIDKKEEPLRDLDGYPGVKPPWGTLTAINLNTGKIIWQVPLGHYEVLKSNGIIGMIYSPLLNQWKTGKDNSVNYISSFIKK